MDKTTEMYNDISILKLGWGEKSGIIFCDFSNTICAPNHIFPTMLCV